MIVDQKLNKQFVGVYLIDGGIDGTQLATTVKPNAFRILMTKWFLGWKWISVKDLKAIKLIASTQVANNNADTVTVVVNEFENK